MTGIITAERTGPLFVVVYLSQLLAGFIAGRLSRTAGALNGGLAGLGLFFLTALLAVAAGTEPTPATVVFSLVVAAIIGSAGGVLGEWTRLER